MVIKKQKIQNTTFVDKSKKLVYPSQEDKLIKNSLPIISMAGIKFGILILSIIMVNFSFIFFTSKSYLFSIFLFLLGSITFVLLVTINKTERNIISGRIDYEPVKVSFYVTVIRWIIIVICVILGQYFFNKKIDWAAVLAYMTSLFQLYFIFKFNKKSIQDNYERKYTFITVEKPWIFKIFMLIIILIFIIMAYKNAVIDNIRFFTTYFMIIIAIFAYIYRYIDKKQDFSEDDKISFIDIFWLIIIIITALFFRQYKLLDVAPGLLPDEIKSMEAISAIVNGMRPPIFYASDPYQVASLYYIIVALICKYTVFNIYSAKIISGIIGTANILFLYLLIKEIYSKRIAIISSFILASMMQHIVYSRIIWGWIFVPFFTTVVFYFYYKARKSGNMLYFVISGTILSLNVYFYNAAKMVPFIFIFLWLYLLFDKNVRKNFKFHIASAILIITSSIIVFFPLLNYIIHNSQLYFGRMKDWNLLTHLPAGSALYERLADQFMLFFKMFFSASCIWGAFNIASKPAFDQVTVFFMVIGIAYTIVRIKNENNFFILMWFFWGMLVGFLTIAADLYQTRVVMALPAIAILAALGLEKISTLFDKLFILRGKILSGFIVLIILFVIIYNNYHMYFNVFANDPSTKCAYSSVFVKIRKLIEKNKDANIFYSRYFLNEHITGNMVLLSQFFKKKFSDIDVGLGELNIYYNKERKPVLIIAEGTFSKSLNYFKHYFPQAEIYREWNSDYYFYGLKRNINVFGWKNPNLVLEIIRGRYFRVFPSASEFVLFVASVIPYEDISQLYRLNVNFISNSKAKLNTKIEENYIKPLPGISKAEIINLIEIPDYESYEFSIKGCSSATIQLDGKEVKGEEKLYKGLHRLKILMEDIDPQGAVIYWKRHDREMEPIPIYYFIDSDKILGLMAEYRDENELIYKSVEGIMQFNNYFYSKRPGIKCKNNKCSITWSGKINVPKDGYYSLYLDTLWNYKIYVNEMLVSVKKGDNRIENTEIFLKRGKYKIKIITEIMQSNSTIRLLWKESSSKEYFPVSPDYLSPF